MTHGAMRSTIVTFGVLAGVWGLAWVTGGRTAASAAMQPAPATLDFKPVAELESLMHGQETHYKAIAELLKNAAAPKRHHDLHVHAQVLAELANVNRHNKDKEDFRNFATQLRDLALKLAEEAEKAETADETRLKTLFKDIENTCTACHDVYQ